MKFLKWNKEKTQAILYTYLLCFILHLLPVIVYTLLGKKYCTPYQQLTVAEIVTLHFISFITVAVILGVCILIGSILLLYFTHKAKKNGTV